MINDYPNALKLTTTQPGIITNASLSQSSKNASANVNINITIQLVHNVPIGGMISIIHPSGVSVTAGTLSASLISPTVTSALTVSYTSTDRTIKITDMFPAGASAGDIYEFQLVNIKNTATATLTSSFDITTFVSSVGAYRIDQVKSGLTMIADWNYPWATCSVSNSSSCNSCLSAIPALFLQNNACVQTWDEGKLPVGNICGNCNASWIACATTDANICTKCGKVGFEFLSGTTCVGTCPDGTFGNNVNNNWDNCDTTNAFCATCSGNSVTCTSCLKTPVAYFLYGSSCTSSCPVNVSIYNSILDECIPWNSNCKTWSGSINTCTSWVSTQKLDLRDNTWQAICESGKTIESGSTCLPWDPTCNTCEISQTTCTSWTGGSVVTTTKTWAASCLNLNEVVINGICKVWDPSWSTCSGNISTCIGWVDPFVLYNNSCIENCPTKFEVQSGAWVEVGLKCPDNYKISSDGTACIPTQLAWKSGFKLNSSGKWVPDGTGFVPFPFMFILLFVMLVVIAGKIKDKAHSRFISNLIALFGLIEPFLMITFFIGCLVIKEYIPVILTLIAFGIHYSLNLTMLISFKNATMKDAEFSRWVLVYRKTKIVILVLGGIGSFRFYKIFYGGLFGLDSCLARFENPRAALTKMQKYLAILSLAVVYLILSVAAVFVLINVNWGFQSPITAIEIIIMHIIFIILHILETIFDPQPWSEKEYVHIGMKKYGEDITMAGVPMSYGESLQEKEEQNNVLLRTKALRSIIKSVQTYNKNGFFSDGSLNNCRIDTKLRRAFSYKHLPAIEEEDSDQDSDGEADYYYQPRRKRRFSIGTENKLEKYADKKFFTAIEDIRSGKYLPDNVYAESHPPREISDSFRNLNVDRDTQTDDSDLKLLWRLARTIPPFKLSDILGEFEMDPTGMFIIIRDEGKLKDKHGRLVNSRGYLIDEDGNIIHQNGKASNFKYLGTKIFNKEELDENDEIPAPFLINDNEFEAMTKPELIPKPKTKSRRPPLHKQSKESKNKEVSGKENKYLFL